MVRELAARTAYRSAQVSTLREDLTKTSFVTHSAVD
jgi:hypothetical protein